MRRMIVAMMLFGCGDPASPTDASEQIDGSNRPRDAGPAWVRLGCTVATNEPEIGENRFCGAVHDYVDAVLSGEIDGPGPYSYCDGAAVADAGPDAGGCTPADWGWSVVESCDSWVTCDIGGTDMDAAIGGPCYHCLDWTENPGAF